jgi:predicted Zn-dependent protease
MLYNEELRNHSAHVLPAEHEAVQWVRQVGLRIARVSGLPAETPWQFNVVDLPIVNAVCFPGNGPSMEICITLLSLTYSL